MKSRALIGSEHYLEIKEDFLDRLKTNWPESKQQIHCGGWSSTRQLVQRFPISKNIRVLDICCGEGATCIYIAKKFNADVYGIDIVQKSIQIANKKATALKINRVAFIHGNIFELPFKANYFDFVIGQDPEGLAHKDRRYAFEEIRRVLKKGGELIFHHWILGLGCSDAIKNKFDLTSSKGGFNTFKNLNAESYMSDLLSAGFSQLTYIDKSEAYKKHMKKIEHIAKGDLDTWTKNCLRMDAQNRIGVMFLVKKEPSRFGKGSLACPGDKKKDNDLQLVERY